MTTKPPFIPPDVPIARSTYNPKFIVETVKLPPDTRTPEEKLCDNFQYFVLLVQSFGLDDAIDMFLSDTRGKAPAEHTCEKCAKGWASLVSNVSPDTAKRAMFFITNFRLKNPHLC